MFVCEQDGPINKPQDRMELLSRPGAETDLELLLIHAAAVRNTANDDCLVIAAVAVSGSLRSAATGSALCRKDSRRPTTGDLGNRRCKLTFEGSAARLGL